MRLPTDVSNIASTLAMARYAAKSQLSARGQTPNGESPQLALLRIKAAAVAAAAAVAGAGAAAAALAAEVLGDSIVAASVAAAGDSAISLALSTAALAGTHVFCILLPSFFCHLHVILISLSTAASGTTTVTEIENAIRKVCYPAITRGLVQS